MSAIMELSIIPLDKDPILSHYVARVMELVRESGLAYELGPMSSCLEGEWDELLALATRCFKAVSRDCRHVHVDIRLNWRHDAIARIHQPPAV